MLLKFILILATIIGYISAIIAQRLILLQRCSPFIANSAAILTVSLHAVLLHDWIDTASGQNLTAQNLFALVSWLTSVLAVIVGFKKPMHYLKIILFSLNLLSITLILFFTGKPVIVIDNNPGQFIHILLSTAALSLFYLAGFQALLLAIQEDQLHRRKLSRLIDSLPSLQTMEQLLFQLLIMACILLTGVIVASLYYFNTFFSWQMLSKFFISLLALMFFIILFIGRAKYGWRGQFVARLTIAGVLLVTIIYFGSQLIF